MKTDRQEIRKMLLEGPHTARDLSQRIRISEKEVVAHLGHVEKSLHSSERLLIHPASCHGCGFVFKERRRFTIPSRCPRCRHEGISPPAFQIDTR